MLVHNTQSVTNVVEYSLKLFPYTNKIFQSSNVKQEIYYLMYDIAEQTGFLKWTSSYYLEWAEVGAIYSHFFNNVIAFFTDHVRIFITDKTFSLFDVSMEDRLEFFQSLILFIDKFLEAFNLPNPTYKRILSREEKLLNQLYGFSTFLSLNGYDNSLISKYSATSNSVEPALYCHKQDFLVFLNGNDIPEDNTPFRMENGSDLYVYLRTLELNLCSSQLLNELKKISVIASFSQEREVYGTNISHLYTDDIPLSKLYYSASKHFAMIRANGNYTKLFKNCYGYHSLYEENGKKCVMYGKDLSELILKLFHDPEV